MLRILLLLTGLALVWQYHGTCRAQQARHPDRGHPLPQPRGEWRHEMKGLGPTLPEAREDAVRQAADSLGVYLASQSPPLLAGSPTDPATHARLVEYVRTHLSTGRGRAEADIILDNVRPVKVWTLFLNPDADWAPIVGPELAQQRVLRAQERQGFVGRVLAGLALLLGAGFGYIRLDQATQSRYTPWLRFGALALGVAAGGAILVVA